MAEPNRRIIVDGVDFREWLYFPRIFGAAVSALQPPRLLIAWFMVLLLVVLGRLWDAITGQAAFATGLDTAAAGFQMMIGGVQGLSLGNVLTGAAGLFVGLPVVMWETFTTFSIVYGLLLALILAVGGSALARMAGINAAKHRRLPVRRALQFAFTRWVRMFTAPLMPFAAAIVVALIIMLMGVLMLVPVLNIIGGMVYIIALGLGLLLAFLLLVYALAFFMVVPALAVENCDGADAQQRAYGYVLSKPLHMVGYLLIALIGLALGFFVVSLFATTVLNLTPALFGTFNPDSPALAVTHDVTVFGVPAITAEEAEASWHHAAAGWFIHLWQTLIISIVWAYVMSYFFSAATTIYLLMRRACDGQDYEEIWEEA